MAERIGNWMTAGQRLPLAALLLAILIWSMSFVAMKVAVSELGAIFTVFLRMLLAIAVLMFFWPKIRQPLYERGDVWWLIGLALCEPCLYFVFEGLALKYTTASEAGMITSLQPIMVAVAAWLVLKEVVARRVFVGCGVAVLGAVVLSVTGEASESAPNPMLGNFLELIAIVFAAAYSIIAKRLSARYSPLFLTTVQTAIGAVFFLPLLAFETQPISFNVSAEVVLAVLFLAYGVNVLAFTLYNWSLKHMSANQVGSYLNLLPVGCLLFGWLLLGEQLATLQYLGAAIVLGGVFITQITPKPKTVFVEQQLVTEAGEPDAIKAADVTGLDSGHGKISV